MTAPIWRRDWMAALARARGVKAIPSALEYPEKRSPKGRPDSERAERTRKARMAEELGLET